jgi:MFS family permease
MLAASGLIGGALGPFVVGVLSDLLTPRLGTEGLRYAMSAMIMVPLLATVFMAIALKKSPRTA